MTITVGIRAERVACLVATPVTTTAPEGTSTDFFAQDTRGNVWWLGQGGEWRGGQDGAQAGPFMPAEPRVGDGFRAALVDGATRERVEVIEVPASGTTFRTLTLDARSDLAPGVVEERTYVEDRGPTRTVRTSTAPGASYVLKPAGS